MDWSLILQITGIVLGLLYLWLEYKADIRLWIVGLVMPMVHGTLYFEKGLYADFSMQLYYVLAGLYGWLMWCKNAARHEDNTQQSIDIAHTPWRIVPALVGVYAVAHVGIYFFLTELTNSTVPFWDSCSTALCIVAMWMLSRKYVEQWLVWLVVDAISVGLYVYKGIPFTAGLYLLYCGLAVAGYLRWLKQVKR